MTSLNDTIADLIDVYFDKAISTRDIRGVRAIEIRDFQDHLSYDHRIKVTQTVIKICLSEKGFHEYRPYSGFWKRYSDKPVKHQ